VKNKKIFFLIIFIKIFSEQKTFIINDQSKIIYDYEENLVDNIKPNSILGTYHTILNTPATIITTKNKNINKKFKIIIDPGHGGTENGAVYNGYKEKDLALQISKKIFKLLKKDNLPVIMTRKTDTTLPIENRAKLAQNYSGLYVSIHLNSATKSEVHGIETFWCSPLKIKWSTKTPNWAISSEIFAKQIHAKILKILPSINDRGVKHGCPLVLVSNMHMQAILIECGFLSNKDEATKLADNQYQTELARAIYEGIKDYWKLRITY